MRRAIVDSDSAATDILIAKLGGPGAVQVTLNRKATERGARRPRREASTNGDQRARVADEYLDPTTLDRAINAVPEARRDAAFQAYLRDHRYNSTPRGMTVLLEYLVARATALFVIDAILLDTTQQTRRSPID